jgi:outer membrane biosynthesis protein TonB
VKPKPAKPEPKPEPKPVVHKPEPAKPAPHKPVPTRQTPQDDPVGRAIAAREKAHDGKAATKGSKEAKPSDKPAGGSRLGADFLKGLSPQGAGKAQTPPGQVAGPAVRASLASAISRALKPNWRVPQGVDVDELVTVLSFDLNKDGSLAGPVRVVTQSGITDSNRAQAHIHAENAIRAVKLAAPFALPPEYYDAWKHVTAFRFDRNLAQ